MYINFVLSLSIRLGTPAAGMYQQQQQMGFFPPQQQSAGFGFPQQASFSNPAASNSMGVPFGAQAPVGGMFPGGPRPAVPVRSGGMRPSLGSPTMANPNPDPFGGVPAAGVLTPTNLQPDLPNGSTKTEEKSTYDPFASLVPGMSGASADKKNMFKDFKIAKPTSNGTDALASNPEPNPAAGDPFAGSNMNDTFNFQPQVSCFFHLLYRIIDTQHKFTQGTVFFHLVYAAAIFVQENLYVMYCLFLQYHTKIMFHKKIIKFKNRNKSSFNKNRFLCCR